MKTKLILLLMICVQVIIAQKVDSTDALYDEQQSEKLTTEDFFKKYELTGRSPIMARIIDDFELRSEPSCNSTKTGVIIPADSIAYVYKYFPAEKCWAIRYHDTWGFITDSKVFPISKRTVAINRYDKPPQLKTGIKPKYPKEARKKGVKGKVYIKVYIDESGKATKTIVLRGYKELNQAAIDAVKKAKYKAAIYKDKKVGVWVTLSINFK
jgi:TonB family protein